MYKRQLEYSARDDKFRLMAVRVRKDDSLSRLTILNLSRIMRIKDTGKSLELRPDIDACLEHSLCREPVVLEISNERNALERTMLHFACYKKRTEKLGDSGKYLCRIYYSRDVETELLIQKMCIRDRSRTMQYAFKSGGTSLLLRSHQFSELLNQSSAACHGYISNLGTDSLQAFQFL